MKGFFEMGSGKASVMPVHSRCLVRNHHHEQLVSSYCVTLFPFMLCYSIESFQESCEMDICGN